MVRLVVGGLRRDTDDTYANPQLPAPGTWPTPQGPLADYGASQLREDLPPTGFDEGAFGRQGAFGHQAAGSPGRHLSRLVPPPPRIRLLLGDLREL